MGSPFLELVKIRVSGVKIGISGVKIGISGVKIGISRIKIGVSGVKIWVSNHGPRGRTDGWTDKRKFSPVFYRTLSPLGPLPCFLSNLP